MSLPRIAVDAMGGDEGVRVMVEGAALARRRHDKFKFLLVGDKPRIEAALLNHPGLTGASEILHCEDVVAGDGSQGFGEFTGGNEATHVELVDRLEILPVQRFFGEARTRKLLVDAVAQVVVAIGGLDAGRVGHR